MCRKAADDYAAVICNAGWLREQGVDLPEKGKSETKAESKKKK